MVAMVFVAVMLISYDSNCSLSEVPTNLLLLYRSEAAVDRPDVSLKALVGGLRLAEAILARVTIWARIGWARLRAVLDVGQ